MNAGFSTILFIINSQDFLFNCLTQFGLVFVFIILFFAVRKYPKHTDKKDKLKNYLFSNGTVRLYMLAYLNLCLFSLLNISEMRWIDGIKAQAASNVISIMIFASTIIVPIVLLAYYWFKRDKWTDEAFQEKYGTFLEGLRHDKDHQICFMVYQTTYFARRFLLCLTLVYWQKFFWGQLLIQYICSLFLIIFVQWVKPLDNRHANNMATFDECATILVLYMLMYFSDFLPDPVVRNDFGIAYIVIVVVYAGVHMAFLYYDSGRSLFLRLRHAYRWRKQLYAKYRAKALPVWHKIRAKLPCCKQDQNEGKDELSSI
mmetsp:Transcript_20920/g.28177  ORF Transcript_20920/g.28177 Transcript_20920/m.28177 type:complete len:315 (-) Transcript_20920:320-1264(-)